MERSKRHAEIEKIIASEEIGTQGELAEALCLRGYTVTQATVSRDIENMQLIKVKGDSKRFKYVLGVRDQKLMKLSTIFKETVISVDTSLNMLVIKTYAGSANATCLLLDKLNIPEVIGTLAGEDTILVIAKTVDDVPKIEKALREFL
jgi:transcriptional regulator of arginine metabolism